MSNPSRRTVLTRVHWRFDAATGHYTAIPTAVVSVNRTVGATGSNSLDQTVNDPRQTHRADDRQRRPE